jgi:hypothetical protein
VFRIVSNQSSSLDLLAIPNSVLNNMGDVLRIIWLPGMA